MSVRVTVLCDNAVFGIDGVLAEHGWAAWLETPAGAFLFDTGSGHHSSPSTYAVDGRQYLAVPVGWGSWVEGFAPGMMGGPHGDALFVFALPEG